MIRVMAQKIDRRKFITGTAASAAGIILASKLPACKPATESGSPSYKINEESLKYRKIDSHVHVNLYGTSKVEELIDISDRLGIEKLIISRPSVTEKVTPEEISQFNDMVISVAKQHPDRFIGQMTLNVQYRKESLEEIKRCIDIGMVGLKVYHHVKINDPLFYPIVEKFIDLKMIILMHAECQLGVGGYRMKYDVKARPDASIPEDFVDIAKRYPEGMFQFAHIGGGGDWEYECKLFKDYPNIYVDTSGSNNEENMIDFALKYLGEDRLFYATDNSFYQGTGKILASNLNEKQKRKIFFENYNNILRKSGNNLM